MLQKILLLIFLSPSLLWAQKQNVWLDSDTGNEIDDLYAIVRLLKEPSVKVVGLSSAHFNNADLVSFTEWNGYKTKDLKTVIESQKLNEEILKALNLLDIQHPLGADKQIGRSWGQENVRDSPAARAIIEAAKSLAQGQKLDIISLGAMTNVASAIMLAPEILPKIRCFSLGCQYNAKTKIWNKNEFNIRCDLNAFDYLLNTEGFDFYLMPTSTALPLQFTRDNTFAHLNENIEIEKILKSRWTDHFADSKVRVMWDLAIVEVYLKPKLANMISVQTPQENTPRNIKICSKIDAVAMQDDFWKVLKN